VGRSRGVFSDALEDGDDDEHAEELCGEKDGAGVIDAGEERSSDAGDEGDGIDDEDSAAFGEAVAGEAMGEVVGVALHGAAASHEAENADDSKVVEGDGHDEDGHEDGVPFAAGVVIGGADGEDGEDETEDHGTAVAHEDGGGWEVEEEEPKGTAHEKEEEGADEPLPVKDGGDEEHGGADEGDAGGEAIHVVEEVEGVGESDDPADGDECGGDETEEGNDAEGAGADKVFAAEDEGGGDGELGEELWPRLHGFAVVEKAEDVGGEGSDEEEECEGDVVFHAGNIDA